MKFEIKAYCMHELGSRKNQEDSLYPLPLDLTDGARCFVLCDGMGGHDSGEVASDAVCRALGACADSRNDGREPFAYSDFCEALDSAYDALDARDTFATKKMGTTMTFLALHSGGCMIAHIGDSRVYHLRPGCGILFETYDHSLVNAMLMSGELTEESAKTFDRKNVITRVMQPNLEYRSRADVKTIRDIRPGDYFFMCSDGVNEVMESSDIADVLLDGSLGDADKMRIIKERTEDANDNHTAFLIRVIGVEGEAPAPASSSILQDDDDNEGVWEPVNGKAPVFGNRREPSAVEQDAVTGAAGISSSRKLMPLLLALLCVSAVAAAVFEMVG